MKVLFTGDRNWINWRSIEKRMSILPSDTEIIVGCARGVDRQVAALAEQMGYKYEVFFADWEQHGKAAGPIRNNVMLDQKPDLVIAFHPNLEESKGTKHCVTEAKKRGIPVEVHNA